MRLSIKDRFAVSAKIDVALCEQVRPVSLPAIRARHQISLSYLEKMFSKLRKPALVQSTRGLGGGYSLGLAVNANTVADIVDVVEGKWPLASTDQHLQDAPAMPDMTKDLWDTLSSKIRDHLQSITLRALADEQRAKGVQTSHRPAVMHSLLVPHKQKIPKVTAPNSVLALAGC